MRNRVLYFDSIRVIAILLVIACHCFGNIDNISPTIISIITYLEMPCIGLFIALSGALLLPLKYSPKDFIKRRLSKILIPTLLWSTIYLCLSSRLTVFNIASSFFVPIGSGILWFIYTIAGLYIISPIISPWIERAPKRQIQAYLMAWLITLCFPIFGNWIEMNYTQSSWAYYLSGYIGFFILGFYLRKYEIPFNTSALLFIAFTLFVFLIKITNPSISLYRDGSWYLSIFSAISVIFYWNLIKTISTYSHRIQRIIILFSNLSFGMYFIHIGIVKYVTPYIYIYSFPYIANYIIRTTFTCGTAFVLSWLISYIPLSGFIIGYKQQFNIKSRK